MKRRRTGSSYGGVVGLLSALVVYGVAFVVRPLGGLFFGSLGDRIGRKAFLTISLTMIGGATTRPDSYGSLTAAVTGRDGGG